jgi:UDP-glucose 4-epimerase
MRRYNYTQNLVTWANIANAVLETGVERVVACSSMAVYGSQLPPFDEALIPQPEDPYGAAKAALEADVKALGDLFGVEWNIARPHNVYGPRQNLADPYRNVVAIFLNQALAGKAVTVDGSGKQTRAFSYIGDVAPVIADLVDGKRHSLTVNIGGENPIAILDLAELVIELTWSTSPIRHLPERHEVVDAYSDHRVLRELYGDWDPVEITDGLEQMVSWARTVKAAPPRRYDYETEHQMFEPWRS